MDRLFPIEEVEKLSGISASRLKHWDKIGLVSPSATLEDQRRGYTFQDIISLKVVKALLGKGLSLQKIRKVTEQVKRLIPGLEKPFLELKIQPEGENVYITGENLSVEPSGQLLIKFPTEDSEKEVEFQSPQSSDYWFEKGTQLDSDPEACFKAMEAYQKAIALDPSNADAYTNLANLHYKLGQREEAKEHYLEAIRIDGCHLEALFNMGNMLEEESRYREAIFFYKLALEADPKFADVYFNLALCLEKLGRKKEAKEYWRIYIDKDPSSEWVRIAREHLESSEEDSGD